jgi:hypothetical protein
MYKKDQKRNFGNSKADVNQLISLTNSRQPVD